MSNGLLFLTIATKFVQPMNEIDIDHVTIPNCGTDRMQKFFARGYNKDDFLDGSIRGEGIWNTGRFLEQ